MNFQLLSIRHPSTLLLVFTGFPEKNSIRLHDFQCSSAREYTYQISHYFCNGYIQQITRTTRFPWWNRHPRPGTPTGTVSRGLCPGTGLPPETAPHTGICPGHRHRITALRSSWETLSIAESRAIASPSTGNRVTVFGLIVQGSAGIAE